MPPRRRENRRRDEDEDDRPVRENAFAPTEKAQRAERRRQNIERQRLQAEARRQLEAVERAAREDAPQDQEEAQRDTPGAELVMQRNIACVHVPLDHAKAIAMPESGPQTLLVLLHTDRAIGARALTVHDAQWAPDSWGSRPLLAANVPDHEQLHPHHRLTSEQKMHCAGVHPMGGSCWVAELPLPAAFLTRGALVHEQPPEVEDLVEAEAALGGHRRR